MDQIHPGEGYWLLSLGADDKVEVLSVPVILTDSYTVDLKQGWNMIGSVSEAIDFSQPTVIPDNSIAKHSLFGWKTDGSSYRKSSVIEPGKGYWVLCWNDCQLAVGGQSSPAVWPSPQRVVDPTSLITLQISSGQQQQRVEIGWDANPEGMDYPLPPTGPQDSDFEAYLEGEKYRWCRQIQLATAQAEEWRLRLKSKQKVRIGVERSQGSDQQELVIRDGEVELVLKSGQDIQLESGDRHLGLYMRLIRPKVTRLLQNYPNPFNPETWIPFELNQDSEVSLTIYDMAGRLVRRLDLGFQPAGAYLRRDRAIYWDGRTQSGEWVASGTYFYTLKTADYVSTQKMIILK